MRHYNDELLKASAKDEQLHKRPGRSDGLLPEQGQWNVLPAATGDGQVEIHPHWEEIEDLGEHGVCAERRHSRG